MPGVQPCCCRVVSRSCLRGSRLRWKGCVHTPGAFDAVDSADASLNAGLCSTASQAELRQRELEWDSWEEAEEEEGCEDVSVHTRGAERL